MAQQTNKTVATHYLVRDSKKHTQKCVALPVKLENKSSAEE
jgi:hypothetical protein